MSSVEVRVAPTATSRFDTIRNAVHAYITSSLSHIYLPSVINGWEDVPLLASSVSRIAASESSCPSTSLPIERIALQIHIYQPSDADAFEELASRNGRGEGEEIMAASVCELPALAWEGLWESLIYSDDIKQKLLDYIYATVVFSDADVDCSWTLYFLLSLADTHISQCRLMEPRGPLARSTRYWQDITLSSSGSETLDPVVA